MGMTWIGFRRDPDTARAIVTDPDLLDELLETDEDDACLDLDKAWHGAHWLLTGSAEVTSEPASDAVLGGASVGEDLGYGPPRVLEPERVRHVADALRRMDFDALRTRLDPARMRRAGIYPDIWDEEDVFEDYLRPAVEDLREFYSAAAAAQEAVVHVLT